MSKPRRLNLTLTLIDDLVASQSGATEGGHESLDFIPGATLLGAVAARLYQALSRADAYLVFHSGAVRFSDGLPLVNDAPCWPMPLCWHAEKGQKFEDAHCRLQAAQIDWPERLRTRNPKAQPKQLRDGFIRADGLVVRPSKTLRMKTAIDPRKGRIAQAQLFGYESLRAGQQFAASIEADAAVADHLWQKIATLFAAPTQLLLGRSRSAEYGRVHAVPTAVRIAAPPRLDPAATGTSDLILWCLTDLALLDDNAQPTLTPTPKHLGLTRGEIDPDRTFLRFRRYTPWNAYRGTFDLQRQVIRRGSVITLTGIGALSDAERAEIGTGIGLYREQGLGQVCIDPAWLHADPPRFAPPIEASGPPKLPRPADDALICWLEARAAGGATQRAAEQAAKQQARALAERYAAARAYNGTASQLPIGPSPAQWGSVYEAARQAGDRDGLRAALFDGTDAICKPTGENWQTSLRDDAGVRSFRDWFESSGFPALTSVDAVRRFARAAQRIAQREYRRGTTRED